MLAPVPTSLDVLADQLERLDGAAVVEHVDDLAATGVPLDEILGVHLVPAWEQLELGVAAGRVDPATSGAAAAIARRALVAAVRRSALPSPSPRARTLVVVSPARSGDLFAADVVAALATSRRWAVEVLSSAAADELAALVEARRPDALVVTAHDPGAVLRLAAAVRVAHEPRVPVLAWGPAFGPTEERAGRLGIDAWAASVVAAADLLGRWRERPPRPAPSARPDASVGRMEPCVPVLVAAAGRAASADPRSASWGTRAARSLVDRLTAAVVLDDPAVFDEQVEREHRQLAQQQLGTLPLAAMLDALAAALPADEATAREFLLASRRQLARDASEPARGTVDAPRPSVPANGRGHEPAVPPGAGQAFADILLLAAFACQTPFAVLSVPQPGGGLSTLSYGFEQRTGLNDARLFDLIATRTEPVEIPDLGAHPELSRSALAQAPHGLRWAYAVPLRNGGGNLLGVIAVFDRWLRQGGRREQRAMQAVARQAVSHLSQLRRSPGSPEAPAAPGWSATPGSGPRRELPTLRRGGALPEGQQLLRSHEVAVLFDVTERTVINWAAAGKLPSLRTIGGHLRFRSEDVLSLLAERTSGGPTR